LKAWSGQTGWHKRWAKLAVVAADSRAFLRCGYGTNRIRVPSG
jgi:hypothetical protein